MDFTTSAIASGDSALSFQGFVDLAGYLYKPGERPVYEAHSAWGDSVPVCETDASFAARTARFEVRQPDTSRILVDAKSLVRRLRRNATNLEAERQRLTRFDPYYDIAETVDIGDDPISSLNDLLTKPCGDLPPATTVMTPRELAELATYFLNSVNGLRVIARAAKDVLGDVELTSPAPERMHAKTDIDKPSRNLRRINFNTPYDFNAPDPLINGVLPASGVGVLYGPSGIGKSFVALSMAHAIASGRPWGERETQHGAVLYMMAEGSEDGILKRLEALRQHHTDCPADVPLRVLHGSVSLAAGGQADMELLIDEAKVLAEESGQPVKLIVVDTLAASTPGSDENSTDDMKDLMWRLQEVSRAAGCAVMAIHHTGKDKEAGMRGSSVIKGSADFVLAIAGTGEGFGEVIGEKMRDDGKEAPIPFRLKTLSLGVTHTGRAVSSCVAEVITDGHRDFGVTVDISGDAAEAIQVLEQAQQAIAENEGISDWRSVPVDWQMWCEGYYREKSKAKMPTWGKLKKSYLVKRLSQLRAELAAANRVWSIKPANPIDAWQYRTSDPDRPMDLSGVGVFSE